MPCCCAVACRFVPCGAADLCCAVLCQAGPCRAEPCRAVPCHAMLCPSCILHRCNSRSGFFAQVVRDLPGETRVALISYSATLSVWHLNSAMQSSTSLPTADVISGAVELENRQLEALVDGIPRYCGHLHTCRHSVQASIKAFRFLLPSCLLHSHERPMADAPLDTSSRQDSRSSVQGTVLQIA
jgi:hypothetical protein